MPVSKFLQGVAMGALMGCFTGAALTYAVTRHDVAEAVAQCGQYVDVLLREFGAGDTFEEARDE